MSMSFRLVIYPEGNFECIGKDKLISIIQFFIDENVISKDISARLYFPGSDEYERIPNGKYRLKKPIPITEIIEIIKKYTKETITNLVMYFGSSDLLDDFNKILQSQLFETVLEEWALYVGKKEHSGYGYDGIKEIKFTSYLNLGFRFILRDVILQEYEKEIIHRPQIKSFLEKLGMILGSDICIKLYIV